MSRHRGMTGKGTRKMTNFSNSEEAARVAAYMKGLESSITSGRSPATTQPEDRHSPSGVYDVIRRVTSPDHEGQRNTAVALGRALAGRGLRKKVTVTEPGELCIVIFEGVRDQPHQSDKRDPQVIRDELGHAILCANETTPTLQTAVKGLLTVYSMRRSRYIGVPYNSQDLQTDRAAVSQHIIETAEGQLILRNNVRAMLALGETAVPIPEPTVAALSVACRPDFAPGVTLECGKLEVVPSLRR